MESCKLCGETGLLERHHLNYKKNKTINVCPNCHRKIHRTKEYPKLLPKDGRKYTLIQLKRETVMRIRHQPGSKFGDSYDKAINRLIDKLEGLIPFA